MTNFHRYIHWNNHQNSDIFLLPQKFSYYSLQSGNHPWGFPDGVSGKRLACQYRRHGRWGLDPWIRKSARARAHTHTHTHTDTLSTTVHRQSLICFLTCVCMHLVARSCPNFSTPWTVEEKWTYGKDPDVGF